MKNYVLITKNFSLVAKLAERIFHLLLVIFPYLPYSQKNIVEILNYLHIINLQISKVVSKIYVEKTFLLVIDELSVQNLILVIK